jgi:hypothetical protein
MLTTSFQVTSKSVIKRRWRHISFSLTVRNIILLWRLIASQLVKIFPKLHYHVKPLRNLTLSWTRRIKPAPYFPKIYLIIPSHLSLGLTIGFLFSCFRTKILYSCNLYTIHAIRPSVSPSIIRLFILKFSITIAECILAENFNVNFVHVGCFQASK